MPKFLYSILFSLFFLCISCCPSAKSIHELSAEEHFAAARQCQENDDDLALAIWHYEQYLADGTGDAATATMAKISLEQCRTKYLQQSGIGTSQGSARKDLEEQLRLLKQRNSELESWLSRLNTENQSLRQALLKAQENQKK